MQIIQNIKTIEVQNYAICSYSEPNKPYEPIRNGCNATLAQIKPIMVHPFHAILTNSILISSVEYRLTKITSCTQSVKNIPLVVEKKNPSA